MSDFLHHLHQILLLGAVAKVSILALKIAAVGVVAGAAAYAKWQATRRKQSQ